MQSKQKIPPNPYGKSGTPPCLTHIESLSCSAGINHEQALCNDLYYYYICFAECKTLFSTFFQTQKKEEKTTKPKSH